LVCSEISSFGTAAPNLGRTLTKSCYMRRYMAGVMGQTEAADLG